jgi:hypothetical protein
MREKSCRISFIIIDASELPDLKPLPEGHCLAYGIKSIMERIRHKKTPVLIAQAFSNITRFD